jgi:hypothetical protein
MTAALRLTLDMAARKVPSQQFEQTRHAETRLRSQMVLLTADGCTVTQVAPLVRRSPATVLRYRTAVWSRSARVGR